MSAITSLASALRDLAQVWPAQNCGANFAIAAAENLLQLHPEHRAEILAAVRGSPALRMGIVVDAARLNRLQSWNPELTSCLAITGASDVSRPLASAVPSISTLHLVDCTAPFASYIYNFVPQLESLSLSFSRDDELHAWLSALEPSSRGTGLRELELEHALSADHLQGMIRLFDSYNLQAFSARDVPATLLAESRTDGLKSVRLAFASDRNAMLSEMATSLSQRLESLYLEGSVNESPGMLDLPLARFLQDAPRLRSLELVGGWKVVGKAGLKALADAPSSKFLERLSLECNDLSDRETLQAWSRSAFPALIELNVSHCKISSEGLSLLLGSGRFPSLRVLRIAGNPIGDEGFSRIVEHNGFKHLEDLDVSECRITGEHDYRPPTFKLRRLNISSNPTQASGYKRLVECRILDDLEYLNVSGLGLGAAGLEMTLNTAKVLKVLLCHASGIHDEMFAKLRFRRHDCLRVLSVQSNALGNAGIQSLGESAWAQQLIAVRLGRNVDITEEGLDWMLHGQQLPLLQWLGIDGASDHRPDALLPTALLQRLNNLATLETSSAACCEQVVRELPICGRICRRV